MANNISTSFVWGYSHWASYFVNDDPSGLSGREQQEADEFLAKMQKEYGKGASIVAIDFEEKDFNYPEYGGLKGEVVMYTVHYNRENSIYADLDKRKK